MDWREALEIVVARTGNRRLRELTGDDQPDQVRESHRNLVVLLATNRVAPRKFSAEEARTNIVDSLVAKVRADYRPEDMPKSPIGRKCCGG